MDDNLEVKKVKKIQSIISAIIVGTVVLAGCVVAPTVVSAEEGSEEQPAVWLQVTPTSQSLSLNPGDTYDGEYVVSNIGSEAFRFEVYASPFSVVGEVYDHNYTEDKTFNQIHRWVTFDQTEYSLPAKSAETGDKAPEVVVKYHVNVPEDAPGGSQHAVLFSESILEEDENAADGIKAKSRVGVRLAADIAGETKPGSEITEYKFPALYLSFGGSRLNASGKVKNTGNYDFELLQKQFSYQIFQNRTTI